MERVSRVAIGNINWQNVSKKQFKNIHQNFKNVDIYGFVVHSSTSKNLLWVVSFLCIASLFENLTEAITLGKTQMYNQVCAEFLGSCHEGQTPVK